MSPLGANHAGLFLRNCILAKCAGRGSKYRLPYAQIDHEESV
jgi:hypothetical protein